MRDMSAEARGLKILVLTPFLPAASAPAGCPRAVFDRLTLLAPTDRVTVLTFQSPGEASATRALHRLGVRVAAVPRDPDRARSGLGRVAKRLRLIAGLARPATPLLVQEFGSPALRRRLRALLRHERFDLVLVEHILMAQYLRGVSIPCPIVFSEHDVRLAFPAQAVAPGPPWRRALAGVDARKWCAYAREACRRAAAVLVPSAEDARVLAAAVPGCRPRVVPFGLSAGSELPLPAPPRDPATLLFVGNFSHPPNVDAAVRLCTEILPRIRHVHPEARVQIVGRDPTPAVERLARAQVVVTGAVPDVAPYLARCTVFTAPLREGGGVRMKLIEALQAGAPIVTTPLGAQGLGAVPGRDLLVADTALEFAAAVGRLLADPELRSALSAAGPALVAAEGRMETRRGELRAILRTVAGRPTVGPMSGGHPDQ